MAGHRQPLVISRTPVSSSRVGAFGPFGLRPFLGFPHGGRGDDYIRAVDGSEDDISCGPGSDRVRANPGDNVLEGCEKVIREGIRVG